MKLAQDQITEIKKFIHSRGFTHIEIEMEILDHVASAVEAKMEKNPNKSISKAIHEVHAGFGVMGFSVMEDEFRKSFLKLSRDKLVDIVFDYIASVKALRTLAILLFFYLIGDTILPFENGTYYKIYFYLLGMIEAIILLLALYSGTKKWRKKSFVFSVYGMYTAFSFTLFGQGFGILTDIFYQTNRLIPGLLFAMFSTITVLYAIIFYEMMQWGYRWTNERYLKYA